jgi:hypothetical protein
MDKNIYLKSVQILEELVTHWQKFTAVTKISRILKIPLCIYL